jgi:hypothetical protein
VERDGTTWTVVRVPDASPYANVFNGVTAVSSDDAWVGSRATSAPTAGYDSQPAGPDNRLGGRSLASPSAISRTSLPRISKVRY